jgi:Aminoglycoside-2''-adenylyltransferase
MAEPVKDAVWRSVGPAEVRDWLAPISEPWWIAGGWALDLFLGEVSRPHGDIDVGIFRGDAPKICATLSAWEFFEAQAGSLTRLEPDTAPRRAVHSLWARRRGERVWAFELMLDEGGRDWTFRRNSGIRRPLESAIHRSSEGIPYLAPEIQLLYKAKEFRARDQADLERVVGRLHQDARIWLKTSIAGMYPHHPWLSAL